MIKEILSKFNLNYEDLNTAEKETLEQWSKVSQKELKVEDIKNFVSSMANSLTKELVNYDTPQSFTALLFRKKRRKHIEARLKNLLLLKEFIESPERAKKVIEQMLNNIKK